jgi:hypothetical protein
MEEAVRLLEQICTAPREVLLRMKAKIRRRSGIDPSSPTLDL